MQGRRPGFWQVPENPPHIALQRGKQIVNIDRFEPTTQYCSRCDQRQQMPLKQRQFDCPVYGLSLVRDRNTAMNIRRAGASAHVQVLACQAALFEPR
jgi:transposase